MENHTSYLFVESEYLGIQTPNFYKNIRLATIPDFAKTPPIFLIS